MKQTLEAPYDPGPILYNGPNVSFSSASQMTWHGHGEESNSFKVGLEDYDGEYTELEFERGRDGLEVVQLAYRHKSRGIKYSIHQGTRRSRLEQIIPEEMRSIARSFHGPLTVQRNRCFLQVGIKVGGPPGMDDFLSLVDHPMLKFITTRMIHLPGLRDNPARFYPATPVGLHYPGVFQPYVASIIASWGARNSPITRLRQQLKAMGLTWKVEARQLDETRVAILVGRPPSPAQGGARDLVNIADVGLGLSQCLPVLVALLAAERGTIVHLEQPELHLHPRAQAALAPFLLEAARRGVFVVAETHSSLILQSLQTQVALDRAQDFVKLHWFWRDSDGATHVDSADFDEAGAFGNWPVDFGDVELQAEGRYIDIAMTRLEQE
jgi:hypothetical protein